MDTIAAIVKENVDQMPYQMQGIGHGRMDSLKYLPTDNTWKQLMIDANEVRVIVSCISCSWRSPDGCHSLIDSHFSLLQCCRSLSTF